ncbi:MAG: exodeoxyribonuclease III, partial [Chloroflexi bacterium]|nr:exodeoxyribonuclease III [Chloroflexota bacterium]
MSSSSKTLVSWNVNGIRAIYKKGFMSWLQASQPDILCLQETRAEPQQIPAELREPEGYVAYWNPSIRKRGYSGTGLLSREQPEAVEFELGVPEFDQEGRTIIAHYADFTLVNCYFPNGGRDHSRVPFKLAFYEVFLERMEQLRAEGRQLLFCGDVNTAHQAIDLARPRANENT